MSYENLLETAAKLDAWIINKNYTDGLRLYRELIGETSVYKMLTRGANSFNAKKLLDALSAYQGNLKAKIKEQETNEPFDIKSLRKKAGDLMNERAALKAQIRMLTNEDERKVRAFRVLDIADELDKIYAEIAFFELNGCLWEAPEDAESDDDVLRRYLNLRTYISRTKKQLESAILKEKRESLAAKLAEYELEKAKLELTSVVKKHQGNAV